LQESGRSQRSADALSPAQQGLYLLLLRLFGGPQTYIAVWFFHSSHVRQADFVFGHENEMHMVRHQNKAKALRAGGGATLSKQAQIEPVIIVGKEGLGAAIAALGDEM
jgi:hypothetical protein